MGMPKGGRSPKNMQEQEANVGASIITNTILRAPYYNYRKNRPQNPILIIKAPIVSAMKR